MVLDADKVNSPTYTEDDLRAGFTISAEGPDAATALASACRAAGIPLVQYYSPDGTLRGWITSMFGLGDVNMGNGIWKYWVQYHNGVYNEWSLGYYTDGGDFNLIYDMTAEDPNNPSGKVPVAFITIQDAAEVQVGRSITLTYTVLPSDATDKAVSWSSSNSSVAVVSNGTVTGLSPGETIITCSATDGSGVEATCRITVSSSVILISDISVSGGSIDVGSTLQLSAVISPNNATTKAVAWSSNDSSVAMVSSSGVVTGVSAGRATITCSAEDGSGVFAICIVTVVQPAVLVSEISVEGGLVGVGSILRLTAVIVPEGATSKAVVWTSSNRAVATVTQDGVVTGVSPGTVTITCTATDGSGVSATCTVTVVQPFVPVSGISVQGGSVYVGHSLRLDPVVSPSGATDRRLSWSSSNAAVAQVSQNGIVTGVSAGTVTITCSAMDGSGVSATCTVTVSSIPVASISVQTDGVVQAGGTLSLTAAVSPSDATFKGVVWTSSDTSVATVDQNGVVTGVSAGVAAITVTASDGSGVSAACTVTVYAVKEVTRTDPETITNEDGTTTERESGTRVVSEDDTVTTTTPITKKDSDGNVIGTSTETVTERTDGSVVTEERGSIETSDTSAVFTRSETKDSGGSTSTTYTEEGTKTKDGLTVVYTRSETTNASGGTDTVSEAYVIDDPTGMSTVGVHEATSEGTVRSSIDVTAPGSFVEEDGRAVAEVSKDIIDAVAERVDAVKGTAWFDDGTPVTVGWSADVSVDAGITITSEAATAAADAGMSLSVSSSAGSVSIDAQTLRGASSGSDVSLTVGSVHHDDLTEEQRGKVGSTGAAVRVTMGNSGGSIHELWGSAVIAIPYVLGIGEIEDYVRAWYFDDDGGIHDLEREYDAVAGMVYVHAVHFSVYAAGYEAPAKKVESITVSDASVEVGSTVSLKWTVSPSDADDTGVTWSSGDASVATVDADGVVTGVSAGTAVITATAVDGSGVFGTCTVTVIAVPAPVEDDDDDGNWMLIAAVVVLLFIVAVAIAYRYRSKRA